MAQLSGVLQWSLFVLLFDLIATKRIFKSLHPLLDRLSVGDTVDCEGPWKIENTLGAGIQGKVFAVRQDSGPLRAMKIDIEPEGAYHQNLGENALFIGMRHEAVPECGILEALEEMNISAAPRCYAACQLEDYNVFVMSFVQTWEKVNLKTWNLMKTEQRKTLVDDNVQNLFEIIQANVAPLDVEPFVGKDMRLHLLDYGHALRTDYQSKIMYAGGSENFRFEYSLPDFQGLGTISYQLCIKNKQTIEALLPELAVLLNSAFCHFKAEFEDWVIVVAKATIVRKLKRCKTQLPGDFLICQS